MDLVLRVASRYILGGFIPDKFFKGQIAELKKLLALTVSSTEDPAFLIDDRVLPFYKKFEQELIEFGMHRFAEESVRARFEMMRAIVEKLASSHRGLNQAISKLPPRGPLAEVVVTLQLVISEAYTDKFKTLGHAFKATWFVDADQIETLAKKLLSKATPAEMDALERVANDDFGSTLKVKYDFLKRVNANAQALKLIKKEKVTWNPFGSIEMLRSVLTSLFTEAPEFTQFDLYGMKVVINDQTVTEDEIRAYVNHLKHAYARLKAKGFAKVWYGEVFISCKECGGTNKNTGGDVGGHYDIDPDVIRVFSRPTHPIADFMVHELGHRHWYKGMSIEQRARFHGLVRTHENRNPDKFQPKLITLSTVSDKKALLDDRLRPLLEDLYDVSDESEDRRTPSPGELKTRFKRHRFMLDEIRDISYNLLKVGDLWQSQVSMKTLTDFVMLGMELDGDLLGGIDEAAKATESGDYNESLGDWASAVTKKVNKLQELGNEYLLVTMRDHNKVEKETAEVKLKEIQEAWDKDERSVMPVSDYGSSNISEAFAEVFMKYIMGEDMNRDQLDSFKSVFASRAVADLAKDEHFVELCRGCRTVISQCRCTGPRSTVYGICENCQDKISSTEQWDDHDFDD